MVSRHQMVWILTALSLMVTRAVHAQEDGPSALPQPPQFAPPPPDFDEDEFEEVDPDGVGVGRPAPIPGGANPIPGNEDGEPSPPPTRGGRRFGGNTRAGGGTGEPGKVQFQVLEGEFFEKGKRRGRAFDPLEKHEKNR